MRDLGIVKPGSTILVPFGSYDKDDGSSITLTGLAVTDIEVYKGTSMTQRASDTGYTLLDTDGIDIDGVTGIHGFSIDLSSNADAGFWAAGSRYYVVVSAVTIDSVTVSFIAATFVIGLPGAMLNTTIASLSSQTSFTLTEGPAENDALNGCVVYIHDVASAVQGGFAVIQDYTGASKTVTLAAGTTFTVAATDNIMVMPPAGVNYWLGNPVATPTQAGVPEVDVTHWIGTAAATPTVAGVPGVDVTHWKGSTAPAMTGDAYARLGAPAGASVSADILTIDNLVDDLESRLGTPSNLGSGATIAANLVDIESQTDDIGAAGAGLTALATQASVNTIDDFLDTEIAAIKAVTDAIGATGTGLTAIPWNAAWDAEVQSEATDALNAYDPPTRTEATADKDEIIGYLSGLVIAKGTIGSTGNDTTHLHLTGLTYGNDEINNYLIAIRDVSESEWHARWIEDWADTGDLATVATLPFTPQNATDTYVILAVRQDVTGGSGLDAAGVRAALGMASANLDTQLSTIDDYLDTEIAAIKAKTDNLPTDPADQSVVEAAITTAQNAILAVLGALADTAADGDPTSSDTAMAYLKQLVNVLVGTAGVVTFPASATPGNAVSLAEVLRQVYDEVAGLNGATPPTAADVWAAATRTLTAIDEDSTTLDLDATIRGAVGMASANLDTQLSTIDDYLDTEVAAIKAKTDNLPASPAATSDIPSAASIADAVWDEDATAHQTTGTFGQAIGDPGADTNTIYKAVVTDATGATVGADVVTAQADLDNIQTRLPASLVSGRIDASVGAMAANVLTAAATATDFGTEIATAVWASTTRTLSALGFTLSASDLAADTIGASELAADAITEIVNAVLTTAMTESYNADGSAPTLAQAMFVTMQRLTQFAINGTTVDVNKLDGSTTAYTLTLDDATNPTSSTRTS